MSEESINSSIQIWHAKNKEMNIPKKFESYTIEKKIEETRYSIILAYHDSKARRKVAIKFIPIDYFNTNQAQIQNMQEVNDPNIIEVLDAFEYPQKNPRFFAIVMPRAISDLRDYLSLFLHITEPIVCRIMRNLLKTVNTLHSSQIWHRNIRLENILFKKETELGPSIALTGFGKSIAVNSQKINGQGVGSLDYAAPELLEVSDENIRFKSNAEYSSKIDMFSIGVVMYALIYGQLPFYRSTEDAQNFESETVNFEPLTIEKVSGEAKDLIGMMLDKDPAQRLSADQALAHPWFQLFKDSPDQVDKEIKAMIDALDE